MSDDESYFEDIEDNESSSEAAATDSANSQAAATIDQIREQIEKVMVGQRDVIDQVLVLTLLRRLQAKS